MRELVWSRPTREISNGDSTPARHSDGPVSNLWDDALTLGLTAAVFLCVAANVQSADWVTGLPLLFPIGLSALLIAYGLSRVRVNQLLLLPVGLFLGATIVFVQLMVILEGGSLYLKTDGLLDRMYLWWSAVTKHGTSIDPLPVIVIMLVITWLGSYFAAWAVFRWRNAALALLPGAAALTWDAGFSSSQFSVTAVAYLILGVLLIMRLRVARVQRRWRRDDVPYPRFIALSVLNVTFWATCALLAAAWLLPVGPQSGAANARWSTLTSPLTSHLTLIARAFISINPDKGRKIHALRDALILQGGIDPAIIPAAQIKGELPPDIAPFLRDQSFAQYRRDGWHVNQQASVPLSPGDPGSVANEGSEIDPLSRKSVAITIKVQGGNGDRLLSVGQPQRSDRAAQFAVGSGPADVSSLQAVHHLSNGTEYTVVGSVSAATVDQLRAAGTTYPDWITQSYLQVSRRLPPRVGEKAKEISAGTTNPYDAATAIESYIRTFPIDYSVGATPDGDDGVDYFLFDARRGYFDYHASAMTMMLRTLGVPARLASGYVIDPTRRAGQSDTFKLTQQQAFAWPEVYFPSIGWVEFNPTPSQPVISRPAVPQTRVPEEPQLQLRAADGGISYPALRSLPNIGDLVDGVRWTLWLKLLFLGGSVAIAGIAIASLVAWEFRLRGFGLAARLWEKSLRLAAWGDAPLLPHETPRAYARRLADAVPAAGGIVHVAASYERARFGNKRLSRDEVTQLRKAWASTRKGLLRQILRRRRGSTEAPP